MLDTRKSCGWIVPLCDPMPMINNLLEGAVLKAEAQNISIVAGLAHELAERRRRPIQLTAIEMDGTAQYGCWLTDIKERFDFIFYECRTPAFHQEHIILHELSHIMLGHRTYHVGSSLELLSTMQMRTIERDSVEEAEAEHLAALIREVILKKAGLQEMLRRAGDTGWSGVFGGMRLDE